MKRNPVNIIIALAAFAGISAFVLWLAVDPMKSMDISQPGADNRGKGSLVQEIVKIGEKFQLFGESKSNNYTGTWPHFRGQNYDNIVSEKQNLKDSWSDGDPEILWSVELGEGHAGPAVYKGMVYVMDYDEEAREDALRCFSLADGHEIWRRSYGIHVKRNHGMSRTVPAVTEDYVVTIGPRCQVMCVDRKSGDFLWGIDMVEEYGSEIPQWYTAQCPMIDGDKVLLAPAGRKLMIAVDLKTGEKLWECPNDLQYKMSHSSIMPMRLNGKRMYVYSADGGICGISAEGDDEGQLAWYCNEWRFSVVAPSPVIFPDGKIFLTAGYGAGGMMIQVVPNGDSFETKVLAQYQPKDGLACEQQTPVYYKGYLYGIMPKDGGAHRNQLVCTTPDNVQQFRWTSGKVSRFGLGPYLIADDKMYILGDDGTLTMVKPDPNQYVQLAQKKLFDGHDAWAPLAIVDGLLLLRDSKTMYCVNISN